MNSSIIENLRSIKADIEEVTKSCGRSSEEISIVAVSKFKSNEAIREAQTAGQQTFGENYIQELVVKQKELPDVQWDVIGNVQVNKVKYVASFVHLIHSVDSVKLLKEVDRQGERVGRVLKCLIQVNISREETKNGVGEGVLDDILVAAGDLQNVKVLGLMGIATLTNDMQLVGKQFSTLRILKEKRERYKSKSIELTALSMGMSGDYAVAIKEGATILRIGSAIFGSRK